MNRRAVFIGTMMVLLTAGWAPAQDSVWVVNLPEVQEVDGEVKVTEPIPSTRMIRFSDVVVTSVERQDTNRLVAGGTLDADGFSSAVVSLAGEIKGTVEEPAEVGVLLVPDEEFVLDALKEGQLLFAIDVKGSVQAEGPAYFGSDSNGHVLAFPRYRVFFYNTCSRTAKVQLYIRLRTG